MVNVIEPLFSVEQARRIMGPTAETLSDEQIKELIDMYDRTAKLLIRSKKVQKQSKHNK